MPLNRSGLVASVINPICRVVICIMIGKLSGLSLGWGLEMGVCDFGSVEITAYSVEDDNGTSYEIYVDVENYNGERELHLEMSRADLVNFRDMIHNLLLDLNNKLGE